MIAIIDYGMGNLRSVFNALTYLGQDVVITSQPYKIRDSSHIILPGVGAFGKAMANLEERGLIGILNQEVLKHGKPFLGICLGLQLLAKCSYEHGFHSGLGWFEGEVNRFKFNGNDLKFPHIGWNNIMLKIEHPFFARLQDGQLTFYFVHSYHITCDKPDNIAATCEYGYEFTAVIAKENIIATQFHPEKSQDSGIQLLENFVRWDP